MTNRLRSFLLAGAAAFGLGAFSIGPAHAVLDLSSEFVFEETVSGSVGTFTIINNSTDWYIWGFGVVDVNGTDPATTYKDWNAGPCNNNCGGTGFNGSGFAYQSTSGDMPLSNDIGPGSSSDLFTFTAPAGSTPQLYLVNVDGAVEYVTPTGVPEPSTWAMLIAGFGFLGWRYGLQRGGQRSLKRALLT